jgi:hypothetical protein
LPRSAGPGGGFCCRPGGRPESAARQGENRPYARFPRKVERLEYFLLIMRWSFQRQAIQNASTAPNTSLKGTESRDIENLIFEMSSSMSRSADAKSFVTTHLVVFLFHFNGSLR